MQFTQNASLGYVVEGNPDLRAERSWGLDGGGELDLVRTDDRRLTLEATGHWTRVRDLITTDLVAVEDGVSRYGYVNIGDARTAGVESRLRLALTSSAWRLDLDLGYTWLHARDLHQDAPLPGRPVHQASLRAQLAHEPTGLSFRCRNLLVGERTFGGEEGPIRTEPYLATDVRVEMSLADGRLSIFAGADNLLNNGGVHLTTRPRTFWLGVGARRRPERDGRPSDDPDDPDDPDESN